MQTIGILAAMDTEAALLIDQLEQKEIVEYAGYAYHRGVFSNRELIVTVCSIGKVSSAVSTQIMVDKFELDFIINTGIAGALDPDLSLLSVVIGKELSYHDFSKDLMEEYFPYRSSFDSDPRAVELAGQIAREAGLDVHTGRIVSGDQFIEDQTLKDQLRIDHRALACEMEGAAISQVAYINKIPSIVIRSISDMAEDDGRMTYYEFKERSSDQSAKLVMELIRRL